MYINYELSFYVCIFLVLLASLAGMIYLTVWAYRKQRTPRFLAAIWVGFLVIVGLGSTTVIFTIHLDRAHWLKRFSEITRSYANAVESLEHWKLDFSHSDWSAPIDPARPEAVIVAAPPHPKKYKVDSDRFLETPTALTAVLNREQGIDFHWNPVDGANGYQIQRTLTPKNPASWVYVHRCRENRVHLTDQPHWVYRVRAVYMTPEDDPVYQKIQALLRHGVKDSYEVEHAYTMRLYDDDFGCFIVGPSSDSDLDEVHGLTPKRAAFIGEKYPLLPVMRTALGLDDKDPHEGVTPTQVDDRWGRWIKGAQPIYNPDGTIDGFLGVDFSADRWRNKMMVAQIRPSLFLGFFFLSYFGGVAFVVHLQRGEERQARVSDTLRQTVGELTEAKKTADAAVRAKSEFLTNMSHEVRTPMNAVLNFADEMGRLLKKCCPPEDRPKCDQWSKLISQNGKNLLGMINDILDFIKSDDEQFQIESGVVSLQNIIGEINPAIREYLEENGDVDLQFIEGKNASVAFKSDPNRIRQILTHLIRNGIKFTEKGAVHVRYGTESPNETRYRLDIPASMESGGTESEPTVVYFEVTDTGIGIPPDFMPKLFEPFDQADGSLTRRRGGMGLGLPVSKRLSRRLGGDIFVDSEPGKGSKFTLAFYASVVPQAQEPAAAVLERSNRLGTEKPLHGLRILVVDDTKINRMVLSSQLKEAGAEIEEAENGQIALEKFEAAVSSGSLFDIVLMDMQMPVMDGYEATATLRKREIYCPVIAVTAHALDGDCEKTLQGGCDAYLTKPVDRDLLLATILEYAYLPPPPLKSAMQ